MMHAHKLASAADARAFALAGNATLTMVSVRTGTRFTYRVTKAKDAELHFVGLLRGPQNDSDFSYLGLINDKGLFYHGKKSKISPDAPSAKAFAWAWFKLNREIMPDNLEIWHEGRCGRCGRTLTVPESIERGIGPECATRL